MKHKTIPSAQILAELLRLQRWAGGDSVSAARIFGLMHGFESVIREENESFGITEKLQNKVETILADVESGAQSMDWQSMKSRLNTDKIDEVDAGKVIELCRLEGRFIDVIEKLISDEKSLFHELSVSRSEEHAWFGATQYMELYDSTEGSRNKLYAVFAASVPRVGEIVIPQAGSKMRVVDVEHVIASQGANDGNSQRILIPYVFLEAIEEDDDESEH